MTQPITYGPRSGFAASDIVVGPYYGPFGQGDDTTAIANAINAAASQGGGRVVIPSLNGYVVKASQIAMPKWVHLSGLSWNDFGADGGGRIQQLTGVNDDFIIFADPGFTGSDSLFMGPCSVTDLMLRGASGATAGHGICARKPDGTTAGFLDMSSFERLHLRGFAKSGIFVPKCSPVIFTNIQGSYNGGYVIELLDDGTDGTAGRLHHVSMSNISGDGNMGYAADAGGAVVYVKGMTSAFALTMRAIKSEYRPRSTLDGGDGTAAGNAHAIILENCTAAVSAVGVTHISNGAQSRRPDSAIQVKGTSRPNLVWQAVALRNALAAQSGTPGPTVRDDVLGTDYAASSGVMGPEADAAAVELAVGEATMDRRTVSNGAAATGNGNLRLTYFTAQRTETVNTIRTSSGTTAGIGATLQRIGVYSVGATGDLTLVASTASDTTLWAAASTSYSKALSAAWTKRRGVRYAIGPLVVGSTTAPTLTGQSSLTGAEAAISPRLSGLVTGQTDLPATISAASVGSTGIQHYAVLTP